MELNKYQDVAMSYRLPTANETYAIFGLVGEVGELYSSMAKEIRDGEGSENLVKELGDILWFVAAVAQDFGVTLDELAKLNLAKLEGRKNRGTIQGNGDDR